MPELIIRGIVCKSVPPLFGVNMGTKKNPKFAYFTNRLEFSEYLQKLFSNKHVLSTTTNVLLTENEAVSLIYRNIMYVYEVESISKRYALDPNLLELAISLMYEPYEVIKDRVESTFRFIKVDNDNGTVRITGLVNSMYQMLIMNDKLLGDAKHIIDLIHRENAGNIYYKLDNELVSLYTLMKTYEKSQPTGITRFKGLGEMDGWQLAESVFQQEGQRLLIQYTFDDAKKEIEQIKYIQSNKNELLSKINVSRYELLG